MKELSIEEKAKAYDEAIEKFDVILNLSTVKESGTIFADDVRKIFPELNESEDEKILKSLIDYFDDFHLQTFAGLDSKKILAWLEKQSQTFTKKDVDDAYLKGITDTKNEIEKQYEANYQIRKDIATFIFNYRGDIKDRAKWMDYLGIKVSFVEMQGKQKPANETNLKIEKGKWYVCISQFCNCIEGRAYKATSDSRIMDDFGTEYDMHSDAYKYFRLWTIKDAKDGDVLFTSSTASHETFIFKSIDEKGNAKCYFAYDSEDGFREGKYHFIGRATNCKPATKEQRDTLMKAMADAGYTFDFEKKELRKIEQNPAWSEEDENRMNNLCHFLEEYGNQYYGHLTLQDTISWLKSLRPQLKRPWKPSKEQIMALKWALNRVPYDSYTEELHGLLEQLKQL